MWIPALHFEMPFFTHKNQIENVFDITQSHCNQVLGQSHSPCVDCVAIAPLSHALHISSAQSDFRFLISVLLMLDSESNHIVSDRVPATSPHSLCNDLRLNNASHFSLMHTFFSVFNIVSQHSTFAHNEYAMNIWYGFEVICNVINKWSFCVWFSALWFDAGAHTHDRIYHQFSY